MRFATITLSPMQAVDRLTLKRGTTGAGSSVLGPIPITEPNIARAVGKDPSGPRATRGERLP
jgi:hypothetical protein